MSFKRSPMRRGQPRSWNSTLRAVSPKRAAYLKRTQYNERSRAARGQPCAVASPVCTKIATGLHHILARGAAGGLEAAECLGPAPVPACDRCNSWVEREGRAWAIAHGLKVTLKG